ELGTMARLGVPVVVRQDLSGSNYGLIDDATLEPNPDYWASLLWRRLMGTRVLAASTDATMPVRVYAHCARGGGGVTLLALNLSAKESVSVRAPDLDGATTTPDRVTAAGLGPPHLAPQGP